MSEDLFELNRHLVLKLFSGESMNDKVTYTDFLKICTGLRIFPDLLSSREIRKLASSIHETTTNQDLIIKLSILQIERIFKLIAHSCFLETKLASDKYQLFFKHIKTPCYIRYGIDFLTCETPAHKKSYSIESKLQRKTSDNFFTRSIKNAFMAATPRVTGTYHSFRETDVTTKPSPRMPNFSYIEHTSKPSMSFNCMNIGKIKECFSKFKTSSESLSKPQRISALKVVKIRKNLEKKRKALRKHFNLWKDIFLYYNLN